MLELVLQSKSPDLEKQKILDYIRNLITNEFLFTKMCIRDRYATQDIGHSTAIVAYANDFADAENLKEQLLAVDGIEQVLIMPLGPVISTHVGPDTLAVFTIGEEAR